jgi:two-component system chemotaxis response regulator CheB
MRRGMMIKRFNSIPYRIWQADYFMKVADMPQLLLQLANQTVKEEGAEPMPEDMDLEANISDMDKQALEQADEFGALSPFSCPDCGGVLVEFYDGDLLRFRCQVGHAYSRDSLLASQGDMLDQALRASFRALDERANLARRLIRDARSQNDAVREWRFTRLYEQVEAQKEQVRQALLKGEDDPEAERLVDKSAVE